MVATSSILLYGSGIFKVFRKMKANKGPSRSSAPSHRARWAAAGPVRGQHPTCSCPTREVTAQHGRHPAEPGHG